MDLQQRVADKIKERKQQDDEALKLMEKHARCAILPSPEKLDESIGSPGSDKTDTLRDFDLIKEWVTKSELLNTGFCDGTDGKYLEDGVYYSFIQLSFSTAFDAMRNTASPQLEELVFWYYAGHGLSKKAAQNLSYSSTPNLTGRVSDYHEGRKVKGGELCLHKVGFCDLYGLLKPWIAAVKAESIYAKGCSKKNKHLAIILDSCYSGIIAQELKDFEHEMNMKDPCLLRENSVTIQAACGPDEGALGGYFTPCFVYLNDPKNAKLLSDLKDDWKGMKDEEKNQYKELQLPSPMVVTTRPQQAGYVTLELTVQGFKLTLFQDPGFFKFCSVKVYQHQDKSLFDGKDRVLNPNSANNFMQNCRPFNVLDYKLKIYKGDGPDDQHANTPMGLFLLKDQQNITGSEGYAVCAHIHFDKFLNAKRINLIHHKEPPVGSVIYLEENIQGKRSKFSLPIIDTNAQDLVKACQAYVESKQQGRWDDISQWNMKGKNPGVNKLFRVQEQQNQRSEWEESYLEHIKKFDTLCCIPEVADNNNCCSCCWLF